MKDYKIEDWFRDTCSRCSHPSYIGAGIKKAQCSNKECTLYRLPPGLREQQTEQQTELEKLLVKKPNKIGFKPNGDHTPDELYSRDDGIW